MNHVAADEPELINDAWDGWMAWMAEWFLPGQRELAYEYNCNWELEFRVLRFSAPRGQLTT